MAMPSPETPLTPIGTALIDAAHAASRISPRRRIIQPLHKDASDRLQRMLNSLQPGTYIRPHRHAADRAESLVVLSGSLLYVTFSDDGEMLQQLRLSPGSDRVGVDTAGGIYHCFTALEPDTVLFEVKPGPYDPATDKEFAPWAPEEDAEEADRFLLRLLKDSS
jgi:cupin fold WbuC family metalloprotein